MQRSVKAVPNVISIFSSIGVAMFIEVLYQNMQVVPSHIRQGFFLGLIRMF